MCVVRAIDGVWNNYAQNLVNFWRCSHNQNDTKIKLSKYFSDLEEIAVKLKMHSGKKKGWVNTNLARV